VGDLHFWRVPANPLALLGKRLLGVGNLLVGGRARRFHQHRAPELVSHLAELRPGAVLFSGDFTTTSLPSEFAAARRALAPLERIDPRPLLVAVPGNHDCYIRRELGARSFSKCFGEPWTIVSGERLLEPAPGLALLAIDATTSNGMDCFGALPQRRLDAIRALLAARAGSLKALWVLCHFPTEEPPGVLPHDRGEQLRGGKDFLAFLGTLPCPVFWLHGHHHYRWVYGSRLSPNVTWVNAGAPMLSRHGAPPLLGFIELSFSAGETTLRAHRRGATGEWSALDVPVPATGECVNLE
jgi:hypothetical protein